MTVRVQLRRGTAAQWTSADPTLASGEMGLETDTGKFKVGDGVSAWGVLPYSSGPAGPAGPIGATGTVAAAGDGTEALPGIAFASDLNTGIYRPGADQLALSTNGAGRLFVDASGNISFPSVSLALDNQIIRSTTNAGVVNIFGGNLTGANIELYGGSHATLSNQAIIDGDIIRFRAANGFTERLRITSAGLVGIGTSAPNGELHIAGSDANTDILLTEGGSNTDNRIRNSNGVLLIDSDLNNEQGGSAIVFGVDGSEKLRINSIGNVGIGTTSPGTPLDVLAQSSDGISTRLRGRASDNFAGLQFTSNDGTFQSGAIGCASSTIVFSTGPTERARIDSSGRLLVGTSSAYGQNYLQIQGDQVNGATGFGGISLRRGVAPSGIGNGSQLGFIDFGPNDGGVGARISAWGDAQNGTNDYPSRLVFSTTPDGSASPVERMRIKSSGIINFSNAPVYADNTAALAGGLVAGDVYRKSDGTLMITY